MKSFSNEFYAKKVGDSFVPYASIAEAKSIIPKKDRSPGLVVNVDWKEYEWKYGPYDVDLTLKVPLDPTKLNQDETILLVMYLLAGGSSGGDPGPIGTSRQVSGYPDGARGPITLSWQHFSDQPEPPNFPNGVLTMAKVPDEDKWEFGFFQLGIDEDLVVGAISNGVPVYTGGPNGGRLFCNTPLVAGHAATKQYVDLATAWSGISSKPEFIAAGATAALARTAIGAGTSSLSIGTTAATAKAGNYAPTLAEIRTQLITAAGYSATATQTLKNVAGVLTWVTDAP